MERIFNYFVESLVNAGEEISKDYFNLKEAGSRELIQRERVYCYELYHQLKNKIVDFPYDLDGELDKNGHSIIEESLGKVKPDFVIHKRGNMGNNLAVIEVKPIDVRASNLESDLEKIKKFINRCQYYKGIMLIYGNKNWNYFDENIKNKVEDINEENLLLVWHQKPNQSMKVIDI